MAEPGSPAFWLLDSGREGSIFATEQFFNRLLTKSSLLCHSLPHGLLDHSLARSLNFWIFPVAPNTRRVTLITVGQCAT